MTTSMFSKVFVLDLVERAVKTFAQALLAVIGATTFDWWNASWPEILGSAGLASGVSVLTSIVSAGVVQRSVSPASAMPCDVVEGGDDRGDVSTSLLLEVAVLVCVVYLIIKLT